MRLNFVPTHVFRKGGVGYLKMQNFIAMERKGSWHLLQPPFSD